MNDRTNITIVLLLISAAVLGTMLIGSYVTTQRAYAGTTSARFGDFVVCPGARSESADNLYVIDVLTKRLNLYITDPNRNQMNIKDTIDLSQAFRAARGG